MSDLAKALTQAFKSPEHRPAWFVAIAADLIQLAAFPFFFEGVLSIPDAILDVAVGAILTKLLGWHWAFLPSFVAELVPGLDLFPSWTAAVFYVTALRRRSSEPESAHPQILPALPTDASDRTPARRL
ncbi:MAG TPA: hypothetical protein VK129_02680 [Terriglobales bacterium]|nr:hypothetical protein [Terriglobales bacterium]